MSTIWNLDNDYPMNDRLPARRVVLRGRWGGRKGKTSPTGSQGPAAATEITMRELTPPLMSDEERGRGDSTNARLHRLMTRKE